MFSQSKALDVLSRQIEFLLKEQERKDKLIEEMTNKFMAFVSEAFEKYHLAQLQKIPAPAPHVVDFETGALKSSSLDEEAKRQSMEKEKEMKNYLNSVLGH